MGRGFDKYMEFFACTINFIYVFSCQYGAIPVYKTLHHNNYRRIRKVARNSTIVICLVVILTGTCGYLTVPYITPDLVIFRNYNEVFSNDFFMTFAKITVFVACVFTYPVVYMSYRLSFSQIVFQEETMSNLK